MVLYIKKATFTPYKLYHNFFTKERLAWQFSVFLSLGNVKHAIMEETKSSIFVSSQNHDPMIISNFKTDYKYKIAQL